MPHNDNKLYLQCLAGNLGAHFWVRVPAGVDPAIFARDTFMAARLDVPLMRRSLKLSGTFVGAYSIITWGYREWVSSGNAVGGRWKLIRKLGEVNERNAGRPPAGFTYEHTTRPPRPNPPPIVDRRCGRRWGLSGGGGAGNVPDIRDSTFINIVCPDGFVADKYYINGVTTIFDAVPGVPGVDPNVYYESVSSVGVYPIAATSYTSYPITYPPTNPLIGNYYTPVPARFPFASQHVFLFDEPRDIFPYETNPDGTDNRIRSSIYKFDPNVLPGQEQPQVGYVSHYRVETTTPENWLDFGPLSRANVDQIYAHKRYRLDYSLSLHYTKVPPGYRLGWGGSAGFAEKLCTRIAKSVPEPPNVCVAGMDIEGGCLVITSCDGDAASVYKLCLQSDGLIPQLRFSEESKAAKGTVNVSVNLFGGGGIGVTFTDESGYRYPLLGD